MIKLNPRRGGLLAALVIAAGLYSQLDTAPPAGAAAPVFVASPGKKLALDFAASPGGGVPAGTFNNFGFSLDPNQPLRTLTVNPAQPSKDVIATYDYADCSQGQESLLEKPVRELARGSAAWVDYVEIELIPPKQKDLKWSGGVCYGFRQANGGWTWNLVSTPLIQEANRVTALIWVKQPDVDALKLVFDYSVPQQAVSRVTVTTQPVEIKTVK